jgi:SAM-dependent methyltransferase
MATGPTPAGIYDYMLGGTHYTVADREAAEKAQATSPATLPAVRENRAFLQRAVRYLAARGVRQYVDVGSGYPTAGPVHEIAAETINRPRVLYVDYDPSVVRLTRQLAIDPGIAAAAYDLRDPGKIINSPEAAEIIDWSQPVAVLMVATLHFVGDAEDPAGIVAAFRERMAPGSYLVLSHGSFGDDPEGIQQVSRAWDRATSAVIIRTVEEVEALFAGFTLVGPGLVSVQEWGTDQPAPTGTGVILAGVGRVS